MRIFHQIYGVVKLVICRQDLPSNPKWREKSYPYENCWEIDEFFESARGNPTLYNEARRIFFEAYWRLLKRYRRGRPFFDVYEVEDTTLKPVRNKKEWILRNIILSAIENEIVPPEARAYTYKIYKELFAK